MSEYRSDIFEVINKFTDTSFDYDPISATQAGKVEYNTLWNDYTYQPIDPFLKLAKSTLNKLKKLKPEDKYDEIAKKVVVADLERYIAADNLLHNEVYWGGSFNPLEDMVNTFEFMPKKTSEDISNITKRMQKIPTAVLEWISCLKDVAELGEVNAKNRTIWTIESIEHHAQGSFTSIANGIDPNNKKLMLAAKNAELAYEQAAAWLKDKYLPICKDQWWVGEEQYIKDARDFSGLTINPREVYEWGLSEVDRINKEMWIVAKQIKPNAESLAEVAEYLNNHPDYVIHGTDNLKKFLEGVTEFAINEMDGNLFTIPAKIKKCNVKLDDLTLDESPYYWAPSDDLKRPAFTIYPTVGRTVFTTWENYSTWFHESVPGHHMQIATSILNKSTLTAYQRGDAWNSGYGEGWALYSETLMDEHGYFSDLGYKMGYLLCQAMRAVRLVIDIGMHLQYKDPEGNVWTPESATQYMIDKALLKEDYAINEIKRYICWSGQAISYKLGERVWLRSRENAKKRLGDKFDIKKFHMHALKLGPMGLDMLEQELLKWDGR